MDIVMGLAAALCWGGTDFLVGINARSVGVRRAVFFSQAIGFVIFSALLLVTAVPVLRGSGGVWGRALLARPGWRQGGLLLAASLLNLGGFSAFAVGVGGGSVAVVTVLSTLSGGIAALLGALLLRERLAAIQWLGVLTVLAGAVVLHWH